MKREIQRVALWIRVSTDLQVQGESPEHHIFRAKAYAEARGWEIVETYRLDGVSGRDVMQHAETQRMLADLRRGHIDGLIFSKFARLARSAKTLLELADAFREQGAHLISLDDAADTSTPAGRMMFGVIAALAEWEREEIAERVAASVPVRARMGKKLGGSEPFGYRWGDNGLEPDPETAPIRALVYELYLEHQRLRKVATILNERGYRTSRNGKPFSDSAVRFMLEDPTPKGIKRLNYNMTPSRNKGKAGRKPESEWIMRDVPAIVDPALWEACYAILTEREEIYRKRGRTIVTTFGSLVRCRCGDVMYIDTPRKAYRCRRYQCGGKINARKLEALFRAQFVSFFCSPEALANYASQERPQLEIKQELLKGKLKSLGKLDGDRERVLQAFLGGHLPEQAFGEYHRNFATQKSQIEREIATLTGEIDALKVQSLSHEQVAQDARLLAAQWDDFNDAEKASVIRSVTEKIVVDNQHVTLHLLYAPAYFQPAETLFEKAKKGHLLCDDIAL